MIPTVEQQEAIDVFMLGKNMKINAYAGSGKTSTLKLLARERSSPGVYLCFNKAIATEAAKNFPETVACRTTHSFAYRAVIGNYRRNSSKMANSLRARDTVDALQIKDFPIFGGTDRIESTTIGYAVNQAVKRFCQSDEREFVYRHFEVLPKFSTLPQEEFYALRTLVLSYATTLWEMMVDPETDVALGHDGYVKVWQLSDPVIDTCFILVDEAQDTNPVMLDVLKRQEAQVVYVGDKHQQIYEWRGAVNAMETAIVDRTVNLTKSFRFGQAIADFASDVLATIGETNRIQGNEAVLSALTRDGQRTILCRTNAQILDSLLNLEELTPDKSAAVVGGVDDLIKCIEGIERLQSKRQSAYQMFIGFKDWDEFLLYGKNSGDGEANKIIKLCDKYGLKDLKSALQNVHPSEAKADILLTTAHKSKGREWTGVELAEDFRSQPEKDPDTGETTYNGPETRLFYVAATRAINTLKVPQWAMDTYGVSATSQPTT
jgi:hypothetical protein